MIPSESDSTDSSSDESSNITDDPSTAYKFQRRRSRAVLYHLSGRFDQKSKHKLPFKKFQRISGKEAIPEYKVQDVQASRFILLHYSLFKIIWDWMILLCTFYIAIMVPYNAAFSQGGDEKDLIICDIIVELLFIVDIILNFWTTYVSKSGQVVYHLKAIAINYLRGWFFLDLLAAIPFDVILAVNNPDIQGTIGEMGNWIHLLKLARLLRLARLFQKIERYSQYSTVILGLLMCMFFLVAHWFACGWYCIGKEELRSKITREYSWLYELGERMQLSRSFNTNTNKTNGLTRRALYVSSLYFTTTSLTSVGFGNVSPNTVNEKIFAVITMLIGALMHAAVFGNVTTLIQRMYSRRSAYQTKNQDLKDFTRAHHIPKPLKQRMLEFFQAMWAINRGIDKDAIMRSFPENLRGDIALHLNREMLSLSLFKSASPGCRKCLAQLITTRFATPGEYLVNQGDVLRFIYFVCSGSLEILGEEGTVVGLLGKCDIFGSDMDDLPTLGFSAYNVKSLTYCELQCIALDHELQEIFDQYPQFKKQFALALSEELSFNLRAGYDVASSLELIPAITVSNTKSTNVDEHSDNSSVKSQQMTSEKCPLLKETDDNVSFEDENKDEINSVNERQFKINPRLKTNNSEDCETTQNKIIQRYSNSLNLYPKHLKKTNEFPSVTNNSNKMLSIEQLNEDGEEVNNFIDDNDHDYEVQNNKILKHCYSNFSITHSSNSFQSFTHCNKIRMSRSFSKNRCHSLDELCEMKTSLGTYPICDSQIKDEFRNNVNNREYFHPETNWNPVNDVFCDTQQINSINNQLISLLEFTKYFIKNENLLSCKESSNSNMTKILDNKRLKTIYSISQNENTFASSTSITNNNSSSSCSFISSNVNNNNNSNSVIHNSKDNLPSSKYITSSTSSISRPCLHQYGRPHYSPENRVVTFQLPPRNHDFRSQSLTNSRQISPETPKANPFKRLLHKHPSISHDID
ncbi:unnamed protein product [Heterobilharzia americana]|nr:unnamed protein product [Heterobilharzia americana]